MTGIMAAIAGGTQNIIYGAGLYNSSVGSVDTSPIDFSASSSGGGSLSYNYTWAGYYRPATTGTVTLGLATSYQEVVQFIGNYNWGGGGFAVAYFWLGQNAISNPQVGNANIVSNNNTATYSPSLVAGIYYPVRINMIVSLPYNSQAYQWRFGFNPAYYPGWANGSFNFQQNGSTNVTDRIWYNTKTNGF
jgi:hypothetical protein